MSDRWFIFKDGQALGPFTPEEIRQSLREGTFDPFDLVSREGSSVRRELVEVDELFFTSKVIYGAEQASSSGVLAAAGGDAFAPSDANLPVPRDSTQASQPSAEMAGNGMLALASQNRVTVASSTPQTQPANVQTPRKRRRDPKHFHVMDQRGRVLGPISASEIQALFYKGVLDKNVKVMRDGSRAQVPVARFVAIYSESNRAKRAVQQGAHPMIQGGISPNAGLPLPRAAMGVSGPMLSSVTVIALLAALLLGGVALFVFYNGGFNWSAKDTPARVEKKKPKARKVRPLPDAVPKAKPQAKTKTPAKAQAKKPSPKRQKQDERLADLQRQRAKLLELKQRREAKLKANRNKLAQTVATKPQPPPPKPVVKPPQAPSQPLPKAPPPATPPKPQGQTVASLVDGQQVQKLGPMTFDKTVLNECDGACTMTFNGAGGSVKVAFFKNVWGPTLESKAGGGVYLSGIVKKNGDSVKIILSNVQ